MHVVPWKYFSSNSEVNASDLLENSWIDRGAWLYGICHEKGQYIIFAYR